MSTAPPRDLAKELAALVLEQQALLRKSGADEQSLERFGDRYEKIRQDALNQSVMLPIIVDEVGVKEGGEAVPMRVSPSRVTLMPGDTHTFDIELDDRDGDRDFEGIYDVVDLDRSLVNADRSINNSAGRRFIQLDVRARNREGSTTFSIENPDGENDGADATVIVETEFAERDEAHVRMLAAFNSSLWKNATDVPPPWHDGPPALDRPTGGEAVPMGLSVPPHRTVRVLETATFEIPLSEEITESAQWFRVVYTAPELLDEPRVDWIKGEMGDASLTLQVKCKSPGLLAFNVRHGDAASPESGTVGSLTINFGLNTP